MGSSVAGDPLLGLFGVQDQPIDEDRSRTARYEGSEVGDDFGEGEFFPVFWSQQLLLQGS